MKFARWTAWWLLPATVLLMVALWWRMSAKDPARTRVDRTEFSALLAAWKRATRGAFPPNASPSPVNLPSDHGPHVTTPAESWDMLLHLVGAERTLVLRLSFARLGSAPEPMKRASHWGANQFFRNWVSVTDSRDARNQSYEHYGRSALGLSSYDTDPPSVQVAGNRLEWLRDTENRSGLVVTIREPGLAAELRLAPDKAPSTLEQTMQSTGRWQGYIVPRYSAEGALTVEGRTLPVSGRAWLSHTWGDLPAAGGQIAFNRWTLLLDDGSELVLLQMQRRDGSGEDSVQGMWIAQDGSSEGLDSGAIQLQPIAFEGDEPAGWRLQIPAKAVDLRLVPWVGGGEGAEIAKRGGWVIGIEHTGVDRQRVGWGFMEPDDY